MPRTLAAMRSDTSRSALDFIHRLLAGPASEQPPLDGLLGELAAAFDAPASGLSSLPDGAQHFRHPEPAPGEAWPWLDDPSVLERAGAAPGAVVLERPGRSSLLA